MIARISLLEIVDQKVVDRFHQAAIDGDVNVVVDMLRAGVPVHCCDKYDSTALLWAAFHSRIDVVNVLMKSEANINRQNRHGYTPLMRAAFDNSTDVIEVLLHDCADRSIVDVKGNTALDLAREFNYKEAIRLLEKY